MRILHVLVPAPYGGLERVVTELTAGTAARGHDVHVAAVLDRDPQAHPFIRGLRVRTHLIDAPGRAWLRERAAVDALRRRLRPDVVHTHGYRADVLHGRPRGGAVVTTAHGFGGGGGRNRVYEALQRRAFRRFDAVVAVSAPLGERLRRFARPGRLRVIPNAACAAPRLPRAEARARLGLPADAFVVGWVGRLSAEKGADVFVDALARAPSVPWTASIVGDGPQAAPLRARADGLGIGGRVRWHGAVPDAPSLHAAFDAFVLSSRTEGTPLALLEALAAGVPVVATAVGGVPDVVGAAEAMLVPPGDPAALAAALAAVHADPAAAAARARAGRIRIDASFGAGPWLDAYESLYAAVAPGRAPVRPLVPSPAEPRPAPAFP